MTDDLLMPAIDAFRVPLDHTADVAGLERLVAEGRLRADEVISVTGKTEGAEPGDTSRVEADRAIRRFLLDHGSRPASAIEQIPMVFTTGGVGMLTPHVVVYTRTYGAPSTGRGLRGWRWSVARSARIQVSGMDGDLPNRRSKRRRGSGSGGRCRD